MTRSQRIIYWIAYGILKFLGKIFFPFQIEGREHIPPRGACILASNHRSYLDPILVGLCFSRIVSYVAKDSLFKNRLGSWLLHGCGAFPIKRATSDIRSVRESMRRLKAGSPLLIFPEGTRKGEGQNKIFTGIGFLAAKSGLPVIPVYISGSDTVLPPGALWFRRGSIRLSFGQPEVFSGQDDYPLVAQRIMARIQDLASASLI